LGETGFQKESAKKARKIPTFIRDRGEAIRKIHANFSANGRSQKKDQGKVDCCQKIIRQKSARFVWVGGGKDSGRKQTTESLTVAGERKKKGQLG